MPLRFSTDDCYPTGTSDIQANIEHVLSERMPALSGAAPAFHKNSHLQFLARNLIQGFPTRYISQDASQPWLSFWTLQSFSIMQVALDPGNKQKAIDTVLSWQHPEGGFGGGPGQAPHLLPTYASVCTLAIAGRPGPGGGWDQIDRKKLYSFFMSLKQPDGSFTVAHHGEVDVRGIYCLLVTATLLDLLTQELLEGTASFLASCQTYEGGFACASQPYFDASPDTEEESPKTLLVSPRPPLGEAHGGYTFCAVASFVMLKSYQRDLALGINLKNLRRWLVQMQGNEAELGGFKGRTNKLVDGCYSWWVGGAFPLLAALEGVKHESHLPSQTSAEEDGAWVDMDESIFNRKALQEYILFAGQHASGGLIDKPPKGPDAYHTLYCLAGLSSAQHTIMPSLARRAEIRGAWKSNVDDVSLDRARKDVFSDSLSWHEEEGTAQVLGGSSNCLNATHPVFNLTMTHAEGIMAYFYRQVVPPRSIRMPTA